jgi:Flp pilus assembly protein TadD
LIKPSIIFLGNFQAHTLYTAWVAYVPGANSYNNRLVDHRSVSDSDRIAIGTADVIVSQVSDVQTYDLESLNPHGKIIRFPYVNGAFLWPYCGHTHPNWGASLMHECGVFAGESGDAFLAQLFRSGVRASEAVERYANLDIIKAAKVDRRYEIGLEMQRLRDQKAGIDISVADYIEAKLCRETLFISRQRLARPMFWHLARHIFERLLHTLGEPAQKVMDAECLDYVSPSGHLQTPIHPKIVAHFSLPERPDNYRYRINRTRLTFDQYTADYINEIFQIDIYTGIQLVNSRAYEAAVPVLKRGLAASPTSPDGAAALSNALAHLGHLEEALEMACVAVHRDVENRDLCIDLAQLYAKRHFDAAAIAVLERALELHPYHIMTNQMLGDLLVRQGKRDEAIITARRLADKIHHNSFVHWRLGQLLLDNNDLVGAERSFRMAVRVNGTDYGSVSQLSDVLMRLGRQEEAVEVLQSSLESNPEEAGCHARLGHVLWRSSRLVDAERAFQTAIVLAPEIEHYTTSLADLVASQGRVEEGIHLVRTLTDRDSRNAQVHALLGHLLSRHGDLKGAATAFRQAMVTDPNNEDFRVILSHILTRDGQIEEAVLVMQPTVLDSRNARTHGHFGDLCLKIGDLEAAEAAFRNALSFDSVNEQSIAGLEEIRRRKI